MTHFFHRAAGGLAAVLAAALLLSGCSSGAAPSSGAEQTPSGTDAGYAHLFSDREVMEIKVEIEESDWQDILDNPLEEAYHEADVTVNGLTISDAGIRTKGQSSLTSVAAGDSDRYGFRVKLDKYVDGQTLEGLDEFVLNPSFSDPSYMREYLTYEAMAALGGVTPYVSYCSLYVNGTLFGFYLCVEALDDSFAARYTDAADAALYKADGEQCTLSEDMELTQFESKYGSDDSLTHIQELVELLARDSLTEADIESLIDVDSVLRAMAVNTVMGNYDSYSGSLAHNYYLLYADGKFTYIGWDYNMSVDGFTQGGSDSIIADISTPVYGTTLDDRPLYKRLLEQDAYRARYLEYVTQLTEYFADFEQDVAALAEVIGPYVQSDPSAYYTYDQFLTATASSGTDLTADAENEGARPSGMPEREQAPSEEGQTASEDGRTPPGFGQAPTDAPQSSSSAGSEDEGQNGGQPFGGMQGGGPGGMGGGGMLSSEPVSIVDYITQRVTIVKAQLDGTYTGELSTGSSGGGGRGGFGGGMQGGGQQNGFPGGPGGGNAPSDGQSGNQADGSGAASAA